MDESSHRIAPNIKKGWYLRGKNTQTKINYTREKFYSFGALGGNGIFYCKFYDAANTDCFLDFIESLQKQFGKVLLFADNVAYHKSNGVKKFLKKVKKDVVIKYFLPYTPELNPIEIQWRDIKKSTANQYFSNCVEMRDIIRCVLNSREVKVVKLFDYLTL